MTVSKLIHGSPKEWNEEALENLVHLEDFLLIRSLGISQTNRNSKYSWSYTKNEIYTVTSGYWVTKNNIW